MLLYVYVCVKTYIFVHRFILFCIGLLNATLCLGKTLGIKNGSVFGISLFYAEVCL